MTPWGAMLVEASRMGIPPEAFWQLSVREWRMLTERPGLEALGRDAFERLARAWPDNPPPSEETIRGAPLPMT